MQYQFLLIVTHGRLLTAVLVLVLIVVVVTVWLWRHIAIIGR